MLTLLLQIVIGTEYAPVGGAKELAATGLTAVKGWPEEVSWHVVQKARGAKYDFTRPDRYVREYQDAGFRVLWMGLKTQGSWAVRHLLKNFAPKREFLDDYEAWVRAMVERYDGDGTDDMPGLKAPVRNFEIGVEFTTFEPEPVEDYLEMLERAYRGAHAASGDVIVLHAALLVATAFRDRSTDYPAAFAKVDKRILHHGLDEIRKILDHPEWFDVVNFHALGDPYEIEDTVAWLRWEMKRRGYSKRIAISDTGTTPFVAYGPANGAGIVFPPAREEDRERLWAFFTKLLEGDKETVEWTRRFCAADAIRKVVIAAASDVSWINTAFSQDLTLWQAKALKGSAGISPWAGMLGRRPNWHAHQQMVRHIAGKKAERVAHEDPAVRIYRFDDVCVAWLERDALILPGDAVPEKKVTIPDAISFEPMCGERRTGEITLTPTPVFVTTKPR